jgi:hypothetical protein
MRRNGTILVFLACVSATAQESRLPSDFRREASEFATNCSKWNLASILSCGELLFSGTPLHVATGTIAPENGVAFGPAFVLHATSPNWRLNLNADAVGSVNQSWRAGLYVKAIRGHSVPISVRRTGAVKIQTGRPSPEFNFYLQTVSLNKLDYYGSGNFTSKSALAFYGMRETITGVNATVPLFGNIGLAVFGEINGRFTQIRGYHGGSAPSIEQLYSDRNTPGLTNQPGFLQAGEGIRFGRDIGSFLVLDYSALYQQYVAGAGSMYNFRRFTLDSAHRIPLYRGMTLSKLQSGGPDESPRVLQQHRYMTASLEGSIDLRVLFTESFLPAGNMVPFYLQPTLGGTGINGDGSLSSYPDYRFRAPNLLLFQGDVQHTIWGPVGVLFGVDFGRVAATHDDLSLDHFRHSFKAGLTIRAGGFPPVSIMFAWGGREGTHTTAYLNPGPLGSTPRPSLY